MLTLLNAAQLVLYIAVLALLGQGLLHVLAGDGRERNVFYKLLQVVSRPFTWAVRRITPRQVPDSTVPLLTLCLLAAMYVAVTFERVDHCVMSLQVGQAGCR